MNPFKKIMFLVVLGSFLSAVPALAADFKIVTPYWGMEDNTYQDNQYGLSLKDSQPMKGFYLQSIDTERYQWNLFIYQTENINYAGLLGANFIYDYYFGKDARNKNVVGIGLNYLQLDLDGRNIPTSTGVLDRFNLDQDTSSLYLRIGKYYNHNQTRFNWSAMPWFGGQWDHSKGRRVG
jgi:hypothetical protein